MTVISVGIGAAFSHVPDAMKSSIPLGELAGVGLLIFFGIRTLRDGMNASEGPSTAEEEMADAKDAVMKVIDEGTSMLYLFWASIEGQLFST